MSEHSDVLKEERKKKIDRLILEKIHELEREDDVEQHKDFLTNGNEESKHFMDTSVVDELHRNPITKHWESK